jgi:hypothetical protein
MDADSKRVVASMVGKGAMLLEDCGWVGGAECEPD